MKQTIFRLSVVGLLTPLLADAAFGEAVGTAFTYQGQLKQAGVPVSATCDFGFVLVDSPSAPMTILGSQGNPGVEITNGLFTVDLDFGSEPFGGDARWLAIWVCCPEPDDPSDHCADPPVNFTALNPPQKLAPAPYALYAVASGSGGEHWAANGADIYSTNLGKVGIGTDEPAATLHVAGTPGVDGIMFPDGTLLTTASTGSGGGDITSVIAGPGLAGGGDAGDVTLEADFGGTGSATTVARSDHDHDDRYYSQSHVDGLEARISALESLLTEPEVCDDAFDNDFDGLVDCDDLDCDSDAVCGGTETICDDAVDNDNDDSVDCEDADCNGMAGPGGTCNYGTETICSDRFDNDADGSADCLDRDCDGMAGPGGTCAYGTETICDDEFDNDGDGQADCEDSDCPNGTSCGDAHYVCTAGQCICESGYADCDGNPATGCEEHLDDGGGTGCFAPQLGQLCGDEGSDDVSRTGYGERWDKVRVEECSQWDSDLSFTVQLDSPVGMNYDLFLYSPCGSLVGQSENGPGQTDVIWYHWADRPFSEDDSRSVFIEIRYISGDSCAAWSLTACGNCVPQ
ncbi:MAG: hypothetical protein ACYTFA_03725 [Planctomycetota bacterium]|jgi:hypothetical protein